MRNNAMKNYFIVSLCKNGILGGGLVVSDDSITYRTNKLTVPQKYRSLMMQYKNIQGLSKAWMLCFPTVTVHMDDGESYKFIVFSRAKLISLLEEKTGFKTV